MVETTPRVHVPNPNNSLLSRSTCGRTRGGRPNNHAKAGAQGSDFDRAPIFCADISVRHLAARRIHDRWRQCVAMRASGVHDKTNSRRTASSYASASGRHVSACESAIMWRAGGTS